MNKKAILGEGKICERCKQVMQRRKHNFISEKQKRAPYHFSEWDVCLNKNCRMIKHYEEFKVHHNNDMDFYLKAKQEEENLISLMRKF